LYLIAATKLTKTREELVKTIGKLNDRKAELRTANKEIVKLNAELCRRDASVTFCMNLSGKYFGDREFLDFLRERIEEAGVRPGSLVFEITETAAVADMDAAVGFIKKLKKLGCRFSLDDFGVGYTSFHYLKLLQVDYIKIDGSFVRRIDKDENDRLFVGAIADLARAMGVKTVAEYVENAGIFEMLKGLKVDYAQGYHLGRPISEKAFMKKLFGKHGGA